jgi:hypothetical protein
MKDMREYESDPMRGFVDAYHSTKAFHNEATTILKPIGPPIAQFLTTVFMSIPIFTTVFFRTGFGVSYLSMRAILLVFVSFFLPMFFVEMVTSGTFWMTFTTFALYFTLAGREKLRAEREAATEAQVHSMCIGFSRLYLWERGCAWIEWIEGKLRWRNAFDAYVEPLAIFLIGCLFIFLPAALEIVGLILIFGSISLFATHQMILFQERKDLTQMRDQRIDAKGHREARSAVKEQWQPAESDEPFRVCSAIQVQQQTPAVSRQEMFSKHGFEDKG